MSLNPSPVSFGQDRRRDRPYTNYSQRSTSNGVTSTAMQHVPMDPAEPSATPAMSPERSLRRQTMGLDPRTPSPQFRNSPTGVQRFGPTSPAPMTGSAGSPSPALQPLYNKNQHSLLEKQYTRAHQEYMDAARAHKDFSIDDEAFAAAQAKRETAAKTLTDYEQQFLPGGGQANQGATSGMAVPFHPMGTGPSAAGGAAPTASPVAPAPQPQPPSSDYVRRGPNLEPEAPLDPSERRRRLQLAYGTAAKSLDDNPGLGTTGIPAPKTEFTYSDTAAHKAVEMGPDQQKRNEGAMLRGAERERQAGVDKNAAQFAQNQRAAQNIGRRSLELEGGGSPATPPQANGNAPAPAQRALPSRRNGASTPAPAAPAVLPPEAHAAMQKQGGKVNPDGTATTPDGKRWVRGVNDQGTPGWKLAG